VCARRCPRRPDGFLTKTFQNLGKLQETVGVEAQCDDNEAKMQYDSSQGGTRQGIPSCAWGKEEGFCETPRESSGT
jgi:hypothetical protein